MSKRLALVFALATLATLAACSGDDPQVGGETHWLRACAEDADCGDQLQCVCGSCTRACGSDASCAGGAPAACYDMDSPLLLQRCEGIAERELGGVCLPSCDRAAQCGATRSCVQDACVPAPSTPSAGHGADSGTAGTGGTAVAVAPAAISDFDDVDVDIAWTDAVEPPEWSTEISGADAVQLVGTWTARSCERVVNQLPDHPNARSGCPQLVFSAGPDGRVRGVLQFLRDPAPAPFGPPLDPERGYPPDLPLLTVRWFQSAGVSAYPYPLRDARFQDGTLKFAWSTHDLFRDWCALQAPQRWTIEGHTFHFCAPQDEREQSKLDPVKLALCASAHLGSWCNDAAGRLAPCGCLDAGAACGPPVCSCTAERCMADVRSNGQRAAFALEGGSLVGHWREWSYDLAFTFDREAP